MKKPSYFFAASIGNLFESYDQYLFAFLAPFLAPLFFESASPLVSLILTFGIMPLGLLSRPLGALVFGRIGDRQGRKKALSLTLMGMATVTCLMAFLPTYAKAGWVAPLLLALSRLMQNFFASGEVTGGALLLLENCNPQRRSFLSSLYDCFCILGILTASFSVMLLAHFNLVEAYWRFLYFGGALTALVGMGIRFTLREEVPKKVKHSPVLEVLWKERRLFFAICMVMGFSHAIYESVTSLMNGYLPFVSQLTKADSMHINTAILVLDFFLLPLFGYLAMRLSYKRTMAFFLLLTMVLAFPLFQGLEQANSMTVSAIRVVFVILGVGFSAPLYAWAQESTPQAHRYTLISFGTAVGSQLIGGGTCVLSLWLYKQTGWVGAPGLYLGFVGLVTLFALKRSASIPENSEVFYPKLLEKAGERC